LQDELCVHKKKIEEVRSWLTAATCGTGLVSNRLLRCSAQLPASAPMMLVCFAT
jgi:hypothetical protein